MVRRAFRVTTQPRHATTPTSIHTRGIAVAVVLVTSVGLCTMLRGVLNNRQETNLATADAATIVQPASLSRSAEPPVHEPVDRPLPYGPPAVTVTTQHQSYRAIHRIWRWDAPRRDWIAVSPDLTEASQTNAEGYGIDGITAMAQSGSSWYVGTLVGRVKVKHGEAAWQDVSAGLPERSVSAISICPSVPGERVAAVGYSGYSSATPGQPGHLYVTLNGGGNWSDITGDLPDATIEGVRFVSLDGRIALLVQVNRRWYHMGDAVGEWLPFSGPGKD